MPASRSGYVYLLLYPSGYKIGRSKRPWQRRKQLQGMHYTRIYHVVSIFSKDAVALEDELHQRFAHCRDDRREFFKLTDNEVTEITRINNNG
jgi:hypothetical protein